MNNPCKTNPFVFECDCGEIVNARPFTIEGISCLNTYDPPKINEEFKCDKCDSVYSSICGGTLLSKRLKRFALFPFGVKKK